MRHLLSSGDLDAKEAILVLDTAAELAALTDRSVKKLPTLRGRTVVNLFFEDSTRTRISFEIAAKRLSADVINFAAKGSSVSKGESLKDTALTLEAMGADAVVIRHPASGAPHRLANAGWIRGSVINAGDGTHEHPTQALLDAFTLRDRLRNGVGDLDGLRVTIVGDVLHIKQVETYNLGWLSPRAGIAVLRAAKAQALLSGRDYAAPDDVQAILAQTIAHRLIPTGDAGRGAIEQVRAMLDAVPLA
jgi:aspartate carbamoyltransferase catalytic subunit